MSAPVADAPERGDGRAASSRTNAGPSRRGPAALARLLEVPVWTAWLLVVVALASVVARFVIETPLWLDEALSVDIARLPVSRIAGALRHDGHPPLYYVVLHGWMSVFGTGDVAVRALSGIVSLLAVLPAWAVGRRLGGPRLAALTVVVYLLSPYVLRYGNETRMYALVIALVLSGWVVVERLLERARALDAVGLAAIAAALLWSHYWSLWLVSGFGTAMLARWVLLRRRGIDATRPTLVVVGSVALGALTFVPWVPTLLYQSAHTGTPWAPAFRPSTLIVTSLVYFAGGSSSEMQVLAYVMVLFAVLGVTALRIDAQRGRVEMALSPDARRPLTMLALTAAIASAVGVLTGTAFAARYAAVYVVFYLVLVVLGLDRFAAGRTRTAAFVVFAVGSAVGLATVTFATRSQAGQTAAALASQPEGTVVVVCPDQLGPSVSRALGGRFAVASFPPHDDPRFVEWVDYAERVRRADPKAYVDDVLRRAGDHPVAVVSSEAYQNFGDKCRQVESLLAAERPGPRTLVTNEQNIVEPMFVHLYVRNGWR